MSETATVRATSLLASTGILVSLVIVALTFTYVMPTLENPFPNAPIVEAMTEPPPPPQPPEPVRLPERVATPNTEQLPTILPATPDDAPTEISEFQPLTTYVTPVITQPHWLRRPRNLQRYYPRSAMTRGIEGDVVLDCAVDVAGGLHCSVLSETPASWGFGDAAQRIAAEHRMEPAMRNGAPVEGRYRMRVPFRLER